MFDKKRGTDAEPQSNPFGMLRGRRHAELALNIKICVVFLASCFLLLAFSSCRTKTEDKTPYGTFYTDGLPSKKWIALTFDDGPKPEVLDKIFETLKKENVKATFFLVGVNVKTYPQYVSKYLQLGHEIGNHTYSHRNYYQLKEKKSIEDIEKILSQELDDCESAIKNAAGIKTFFMRMPNGFNSPTVKKVAKEKKYVVVNWTFGCDWHGYTKNELVKKYLRSVEPGAIFLLHEKKVTAEALPEIIRGIKKKGYEIVTLRKILGIDDADR
ncbi:MAG: polysaccharide deacetylase family protein [Elusimicrobia bacterium]|nr:polysaccharide deacetylase family protein [Elusimicrobiota bacterium]